MARTVKAREHAAKRNQILDAAQTLVVTRGYGKIAVRDITTAIGISSGAFHHYFASREALLDALIQRMQEQAESPLQSILRDKELLAPEKLRRLFAALERQRTEQKTFLSGLAPVWYADDNAVVRRKVENAMGDRRAPLLAGIVRQGIRERSFATGYPEQMGRVIVSLMLGQGDSMARLLLSAAPAQEIVATYNVFMESVERALGARPFLDRLEAQTVKKWFAKSKMGR